MVGFGFIYTLPQQFFLTASAWSGAAPTAGAPPAAAADVARQAASSAVADTHAGSEPGNSDSGATCITCGIGVTAPAFANLQEQRQHFKSDWHRYNVKRRVDRKSAVTEQEFERLLEEEAEVRVWADILAHSSCSTVCLQLPACPMQPHLTAHPSISNMWFPPSRFKLPLLGHAQLQQQGHSAAAYAGVEHLRVRHI
jgi:hypothetical protein